MVCRLRRQSTESAFEGDLERLERAILTASLLWSWVVKIAENTFIGERDVRPARSSRITCRIRLQSIHSPRVSGAMQLARSVESPQKIKPK